MIRRLRIAVSVFFAVLTVLLCVLWVRSYWRNDRVLIPIPRAYRLHVTSLYGQAEFSMHRVPIFPNEFHWFSFAIDDDFWNGTPIKKPILEWRSVPGFTSVLAPYRLLIAVSGILAVIPWIPWSGRFRLRTMFIVMTLIAVVLAVWFTA